MANWTRAQEDCLAKWLRVRELIGKATVPTLLDHITSPCAFCMEAEQGIRQGKPPHTPTNMDVKCLYCDGYREQEGCLFRLDDLVAACMDGNWDLVRTQVDEMINWIGNVSLIPRSSA